MGFISDLIAGLRGTTPGTKPPPSKARATVSTDRQAQDFRAATLPPGFERLIQGPPLNVVGESHYRAKIERVVGRAAEGHADIVDATLVAEPTNKHDPNAIAVQLGGVTCGYLSRTDAKRYGPVVEWATTRGVTPVVRGDVKGGWRDEYGEWADFGIVLYVASAEKILGRG